jgi:hypothetical protein
MSTTRLITALHPRFIGAGVEVTKYWQVKKEIFVGIECWEAEDFFYFQ